MKVILTRMAAGFGLAILAWLALYGGLWLLMRVLDWLTT